MCYHANAVLGWLSTRQTPGQGRGGVASVSLRRFERDANDFRMLERLANVVYWTCNGAAGLCVVIGCFVAKDDGVVAVLAGAVLGALFYGVGRAVRYIVAGK